MTGRRAGGREPPLSLAFATLALGTGAFMLGSFLPDRSGIRMERPARPVNAGALNPRDIRAHNSPSVARNPRRHDNLVVANRIDTPSFACALHVSHDEGTTWNETPVPLPEGEEPKCYAPDVTFGSDGTLYLVFVTLAGVGNVPRAVWTTMSEDGGATLSAPRKALGPNAFQVRVAADPETPRTLYLSWLQVGEVARLGFATVDNTVHVARSADGGVTWQSASRVNRAQGRRALAPSLAVGGRGHLALAYLDLGDDVLDYSGAHEGRGGDPYPGRWKLIVATSNDGGELWTESLVDESIAPAERVVVFIPPSPSIAVSPRSGTIHVTFTDARAGDADVWLWSSRDRGVTWVTPQRVNDTPLADGTAQYLPKVAVARNGRVDVVYYDRRADADNNANEVSLQSSFDDGRSFTGRTRLSDRSFDSRVGFGSERGLPDLGSRLGLTTTNKQAIAVWSDTRAGTEASNKQDLATVAVRFPGEGRPAKVAAPLRHAGAALSVIALIVCLVGLRRRSTSGERAAPPPFPEVIENRVGR